MNLSALETPHTCGQCNAIHDPAADVLDAAWAAAEAAWPNDPDADWAFVVGPVRSPDGGIYRAVAWGNEIKADGSTPAAALRALAEKLRR